MLQKSRHLLVRRNPSAGCHLRVHELLVHCHPPDDRQLRVHWWLVRRHPPSTIRLDALVLLLAEGLCGARCSSVKQVGSSVQRAAA